jgi:hypothetical protein
MSRAGDRGFKRSSGKYWPTMISRDPYFALSLSGTLSETRRSRVCSKERCAPTVHHRPNPVYLVGLAVVLCIYGKHRSLRTPAHRRPHFDYGQCPIETPFPLGETKCPRLTEFIDYSLLRVWQEPCC